MFIILVFFFQAPDFIIDIPPPDPPTKTILTKGSLNMTYASLKSLQVDISQQEVDFTKSFRRDFCKGWLFEDVIDSYFEWLSLRNPSILICKSTIFLSILPSPTLELLWQNEYVRQKDLILAPYNIDSNHWALVSVNLNNREILYIDPGQTSTEIKDFNFKEAKGIMSKILRQKFDLDINDFKTYSPPHITQKDTYNCGVYICFYAQNITEVSSIESDFDIKKFRRHIFEAITGKYLTNSNQSGLEGACNVCTEPLVSNSVNCKICGRLLHESC